MKLYVSASVIQTTTLRNQLLVKKKKKKKKKNRSGILQSLLQSTGTSWTPVPPLLSGS